MGDEEAVDVLVRAVEHASPSGSEAAAAAFLADALRPWAERAEVDAAGNAVAWFGSGPRRIVALGHVDTAPGWWPVTRTAHVLHGRGSVDAKGALCAAAVAAARLPAALRARLSVQVIAAVEEESSTSRGARHALEAYGRPDLVIVGEPSGWDAYTLGYKGRLLAEVSVERPEGHSAGPEASAAAVAALAWRELEAWAERESAGARGAFDAVQATLVHIASASDGLVQRATARVSFRLPLGLAPTEAAEAVADTLRDLTERTGATVRIDGGEPAHRGERDGPLARAFRVAIRAEGGVPRPLLKTGTSDMNVVAPTWNVPIVAYGPGDASLDHTPDERLDLREYLRSIRVLERVFAALAG